MENKQTIQLFLDYLKKNKDVLLVPAAETLQKMHQQNGFGYKAVDVVLSYFLGEYQSKGAFLDSFSFVYRRRIRFLYLLLARLDKEKELSSAFLKLKKETNLKKTGYRSNEAERQVAFMYAAILSMQGDRTFSKVRQSAIQSKEQSR